MTAPKRFEIFLVSPPGLEDVLLAEARAAGFQTPRKVAGGVSFMGRWEHAWKANLVLRGATRVLVRLGSFRALHLAQLDKRVRQFPWAETLKAGVAVKVEATCHGSRIYHAGAVEERLGAALSEKLGVPVSPEAEVVIKLRIEDDLCTVSVDTSGPSLHKRGHKTETGKAPMRETLAASFLSLCGYTGKEPVLDPLCGSGTFVIEAAEMALGLKPGRGRPFAFEQLATFEPDAWQRLKDSGPCKTTPFRFFGSDRDAGAVRMATANAARAGVAEITSFQRQAISALMPPPGSPGLVIANPPYGDRIGDRRQLYGLYGALGKVLIERFAGWRVGIITSDAALAHATALPFAGEPRSTLHGGLRVHLFRTEALPVLET